MAIQKSLKQDLFEGVDYDANKIQSFESLERYKSIQQIIDNCVRVSDDLLQFVQCVHA